MGGGLACAAIGFFMLFAPFYVASWFGASARQIFIFGSVIGITTVVCQLVCGNPESGSHAGIGLPFWLIIGAIVFAAASISALVKVVAQEVREGDDEVVKPFLEGPDDYR